MWTLLLRDTLRLFLKGYALIIYYLFFFFCKVLLQGPVNEQTDLIFTLVFESSNTIQSLIEQITQPCVPTHCLSFLREWSLCFYHIQHKANNSCYLSSFVCLFIYLLILLVAGVRKCFTSLCSNTFSNALQAL